jgi:hypothetical protein
VQLVLGHVALLSPFAAALLFANNPTVGRKCSPFQESIVARPSFASSNGFRSLLIPRKRENGSSCDELCLPFYVTAREKFAGTGG